MILQAKLVLSFFWEHILFKLSNSSKDSTFKQKILFSTAKDISSSVFPIPAKTIDSGLKYFKANLTSPPETQSAPISGWEDKILRSFSLKFDFREKCILILFGLAIERHVEIVFSNNEVS